MPNTVLAPVAPVEQPPASVRSWWPLLSLTLALSALWFVCFRHLSAEWSYNEQYSYGWFVPIFALYLFWLRWEDRPQPEIRGQRSEDSGQSSELSRHSLAAPKPGEGGSFAWHAEAPRRRLIRLPRRSDAKAGHSIAIAIAIALLLLLLPIRLIEVANPDWRPISWLHTIAAVGLTLLVIWRIGGRPWLRHFAFPVMFVLVAVPWISAIEVPIVQGLMPTLASIATEAISLFGIPAEVQGNLVRINGGVVGVNEACSGVRSLQTSIMIGLLFGELKRFGVIQRILLIAGAIAIAFVANCGRAFFLVWIAATRGLTAVEKWHDIAGYTIVALVFLGCLGITAWLARAGRRGERTEDRGQRSEVSSQMSEDGDQKTEDQPAIRHSSFVIPTRLLATGLVWLLLVEIAVESWYRAHERNLPRTAQWSVQWPKSSPDFRELPIDERTRGLLHFDKGRGVSWRKPNEEKSDMSSSAIGQPVSLLYFFRWEPGHNSALLANAHRPDVCLPATGWRQTEDLGVKEYRVSADLSVPFRHFVFVHETAGRSQYAHAFYCVWEDRVRPSPQANSKDGMAGDPSAWTRNERMNAVLDGRRHLGQQVLEYLLVDPRPIRVADAEQTFARQVPQLIQPGAKPAAD